LASAKGIAITAAIVVGVIAASMLVWFSPQGQSNDASLGREVTADNINSFRSDEAFGSIYSRQQDLDAEVQLDYDKWKGGDLDSSQMLQTISGAKADTAEMKAAFEAATPPEEWKASFGHYSTALDSYASYLDEVERIVRDGDTNADETTLKGYWQDSENHVDLAAKAIPVSTISTN
jgi:hypothetical protein